MNPFVGGGGGRLNGRAPYGGRGMVGPHVVFWVHGLHNPVYVCGMGDIEVVTAAGMVAQRFVLICKCYERRTVM